MSNKESVFNLFDNEDFGDLLDICNTNQFSGFSAASSFKPASDAQFEFNNNDSISLQNSNINSEFTNISTKDTYNKDDSNFNSVLSGFNPGSSTADINLFHSNHNRDKENNFETASASLSGTNNVSTAQSNSFTSVNNSVNKNLQFSKASSISDKGKDLKIPNILGSKPLNNNSKGSIQGTPTFTKTKGFVSPSLKQEANSNENSFDSSNNLGHNKPKTPLSTNKYQSLTPKQFLSPMKTPNNIGKKMNTASKPPQMFKPFTPHPKNSSASNKSITPTKRLMDPVNVPNLNNIYSNNKVYDPAQKIARKNFETVKNENSINSNSTSYSNGNHTSNAIVHSHLNYNSNLSHNYDSKDSIYDNELNTYLRCQLSPDVLNMDLQKAVSYEFNSMSATSISNSTHFGPTMGWNQISVALDSLSPMTKSQLDQWVKNHYAMVVWKLASYVRSYPSLYNSNWNWQFVFEQVKARFRQEVLIKNSSCLKMIVEQTTVSFRYFVGIVSKVDIGENNQIGIEISDGWYRVKCQLDAILTDAVRSEAIFLGMKLAICGATLESPGPMPILESENEVELKLNANGVRRARWDSLLGFQDSLYFTMHLSNIDLAGGTVTAIDAIVLRKYPLKYIETLSSDKKIVRTEDEEIQYCYELEERYCHVESSQPSSPSKKIQRDINCSFKILIKDSNTQHGDRYAMITFWNTIQSDHERIPECSRLTFFNLRPYNQPKSKQSNLIHLSTSNTTRWDQQSSSQRLDLTTDTHFRHILSSNEIHSFEFGQDIDLIAWYAGNILNGHCFVDQTNRVYLVQLSPYASQDYFKKLKLRQMVGLTDLKWASWDAKFDLNVVKQYSETQVHTKSNSYFKQRWIEMTNYMKENVESIQSKFSQLQILNEQIQSSMVILPKLQNEPTEHKIEKCGRFISLEFQSDHYKIIGQFGDLDAELINSVMDLEKWIEVVQLIYNDLAPSDFKAYLIDNLNSIDNDAMTTWSNKIPSFDSIKDFLMGVFKQPTDQIVQQFNTNPECLLLTRHHLVEILSYPLLTDVFQASFTDSNYHNESLSEEKYYKIEKLMSRPMETIIESLSKAFI